VSARPSDRALCIGIIHEFSDWEDTMSGGKKFRCEDCPIRKKAEANPKSFVGILWRLHTKICPGWKAYQRSLR